MIIYTDRQSFANRNALIGSGDVQLIIGGRERKEMYIGMIGVHEARDLEGARPVRMNVYAYHCSEDQEPTILDRDQFLKGCLVRRGVYTVMENGSPVVVGLPF